MGLRISAFDIRLVEKISGSLKKKKEEVDKSNWFLNMFSSKVSSAIRNFSTSALRKHGAHDYGGVPYKNMPFKQKSKLKMLMMFIAFHGSGFGLPFLLVRHQLLKD